MALSIFAGFSFSLFILFYFFSYIDIAFSSFFYDEALGFFMQNNVILTSLHDFVFYFVGIISAFYLLVLLLNYIRNKVNFGFTNRAIVFLIVVLVVGPGILINGILKSHWGRARPAEIVQFGGEKLFSKPFIIANQCESDCSFVSGHASIGFYLIAIALFALRCRLFFVYLGVGAGLLIGLARIVQGQHFLSDVLFSGIVMAIVVMVCNYYIKPLQQY